MLAPLAAQYVELDVATRDFFVTHHKLDSAACKRLNKSRKRVYQLADDCPCWLSELCKRVAPEYFTNQESERFRERHFICLDEDANLPESISQCWSVLSKDDMKDVESRRSHQIEDWLHAEAGKWSKKTAEGNKGIRDQNLLFVTPMRETMLSSWADDAVRTLAFETTSFGPLADMVRTV